MNLHIAKPGYAARSNSKFIIQVLYQVYASIQSEVNIPDRYTRSLLVTGEYKKWNLIGLIWQRCHLYIIHSVCSLSLELVCYIGFARENATFQIVLVTTVFPTTSRIFFDKFEYLSFDTDVQISVSRDSLGNLLIQGCSLIQTKAWVFLGWNLWCNSSQLLCNEIPLSKLSMTGCLELCIVVASEECTRNVTAKHMSIVYNCRMSCLTTIDTDNI